MWSFKYKASLRPKTIIVILHTLLEAYLHLSHSSEQRDEHDHSHELCEEDERSEDGPHWPECYVKAAREGHVLLINMHNGYNFFDDKKNCWISIWL